jgi:integrase/recombinase XerD
MKTYLEPEEISRLEKACSNLRDRLLIRFLFHLGCRVSEALAIPQDDIDFQARTITILHLKTRLRLSCASCGAALERKHIFCPGCGAKVGEAVAKDLRHRRQRTIPVDADTLKMLTEYVERGGAVQVGGKRLIFGINRHRAWQIIKQCAEMAGLPKLINPDTGRAHNVSPHRLRDSFAVNAIKHDDSGDGLRMLQQHLGHQSFNTTARYRKVSGEEQRAWFDRLWEQQ